MRHKHSTSILPLLMCLFVPLASVWGRGDESELKTFRNCELVPMRGADGDSFKVKFPDGEFRVVRLYSVDCIESNIWDEADSRRLREQRRYFGISHSKKSIEMAKNFGRQAHQEVEKLLSKPFTVHTAFADGRGSGYHKRIYGFITTAGGKDLGTHLVGEGLARAMGVCRQSPSGLTRDELRGTLEDLELRAARLGKGIWAKTNWQTIAQERAIQRRDEAELAAAIDRARFTEIVDPNTAARDELMTLSGIGETIAVRIIENRPYRKPADLLKVKGFGKATLEKNRHRLPKVFEVSTELARRNPAF